MTTRYFCTYFDRNYLIKGLALIDSLKKHSESDFKLFVVCMDEVTRIILEKLNIKEVVTIPMHLIEQGDTALLATKENRSVVEYLWTTTPTIILRVIEHHPEIDILTYLDADLFFYGSPEPLYSELGSKSVLIHEHRFPPHLKYLEKNGIFNVGLLCFKNDRAGLEVLRNWRDRCLEWCYDRHEDSKFGDQGYLNAWPSLFPSVLVTQNIGVGVAPWNHLQYSYSCIADGQVMVNGVPLMVYHYHSFTFINPGLFVPTPHIEYTPSWDLMRFCILPYAEILVRRIKEVQRYFPDFECGLFKMDFQVSPQQSFIARTFLKTEITNLNLSQKPIRLNSDWNLYQS